MKNLKIRGNSGNARKKTFFLQEVFPYTHWLYISIALLLGHKLWIKQMSQYLYKTTSNFLQFFKYLAKAAFLLFGQNCILFLYIWQKLQICKQFVVDVISKWQHCHWNGFKLIIVRNVMRSVFKSWSPWILVQRCFVENFCWNKLLMDR